MLRSGFSQAALKLWAAGFMVIDHIGAVLIEGGLLKTGGEPFLRQPLWQLNLILRSVGRLAFPIFAFCLVEGFCHTHHRKAYSLRLLLFALLSEVIFDLAVFDTWYYPQYQNIYLTLLLAYMTMWGMERFRETNWLSIVIASAGCAAAYFLRADYGPYGVLLILLLYRLRGRRLRLWAGAAFAMVESLYAGLAFILLAFYNKERGCWPGKYFFYLFYPAHLLCLYWIRVLVISPVP